MPAQFYTYLWLREDGTPYYAGKVFGKHRSTATKNKISKAHEGMKYSAAHCETLSKVGKELAKSPEVLARLRANARLGAIARWGSKETTCLPN